MNFRREKSTINQIRSVITGGTFACIDGWEKKRENKLETVTANYRSEAIKLMIQLPQPFKSFESQPNFWLLTNIFQQIPETNKTIQSEILFFNYIIL